jgi:actin-related protein
MEEEDSSPPMEEDYEPSVVTIDAGTSELRAGFSGDKFARHIDDNVIGRAIEDAGPAKYYIGYELLRQPASQFTRECPLQKGVVVNWDLMERVWLSVMGDHLRTSPEDHPLVLTDMTFSPHSQREKMTEISFETCRVPSLRIIDQAAAGLAFEWRSHGLVVDMGYESIRIVPVYEGHAIKLNGVELNYGGKDLTSYLERLMPEVKKSYIEEAKRWLCYVAEDIEKEMIGAKQNPSEYEKSWESGDDKVTAGSERFQCPEALFDPSLIGKVDKPLHKAVFDVLMTFDPDLRAEFMRNIFICGRPADTPGLSYRLQLELEKLGLADNDQKMGVRAPPGSRRAQYYGASYMSTPIEEKGKIWEARREMFWQAFATKENYDEIGPGLAHRMFY